MTGNMFQDYLMQLCAATGRSVDIAETPTSLILDNMPLEVSDVLRDKAELWESAGVVDCIPHRAQLLCNRALATSYATCNAYNHNFSISDSRLPI